jgi:tetratricopeptide (TPR) repeat protein
MASLLFAQAMFAQAENPGQPILAALRAQRYAEAKQLSEAALKQSPSDPKLWVLNGIAVEHLHEYSNALKSYDQALQIAPNYLPALAGAGQLEYARGSQQAIPYLQRLLQLKPADDTTHAMLAALAFRRGDCPTVVAEYQHSRAVINSQPLALEQLGACLVKAGRVGEAVSTFQGLLDLQPDNQNFRYNLAVVESLDSKPRDVIATLTRGPQQSADPEALDLLAEAYEAVDDTPKAVQALRTAIVQDPNQPRYYVDFANISLVHASFQVGIDMVNVGLRHLPNSAPLYVARGVLYVSLGDYDKSDADFKTAERLDPQVEAAASARGLSAFEQNHLPEAESMIRERLRKNTKDPFLFYLLAEVLARRGASPGSPTLDEAIHAARTAVQLQPNFELARDVLARLYLQADKTTEAVAESRAAVRQDPDDQTALYHLILALKKAQQTEELPGLLKRLTDLRQAALRKESHERHFVLQEESASSETSH